MPDATGNSKYVTVTMPDGSEVVMLKKHANLAVHLGNMISSLRDDERQAFEVLMRRAETARMVDEMREREKSRVVLS